MSCNNDSSSRPNEANAAAVSNSTELERPRVQTLQRSNFVPVRHVQHISSHICREESAKCQAVPEPTWHRKTFFDGMGHGVNMCEACTSPVNPSSMPNGFGEKYVEVEKRCVQLPCMLSALCQTTSAQTRTRRKNVREEL